MYGGTHEFMKHEDDVETAGPTCPLIFHANPSPCPEIETIEKVYTSAVVVVGEHAMGRGPMSRWTI